IGIMYRGRIVEIGRAADVTGNPLHPYTRLLLSAIPLADASAKRKRVVSDLETVEQEMGAVGCKFQFRCPLVMDVCRTAVPELVEIESEHTVACYAYPSTE